MKSLLLSLFVASLTSFSLAGNIPDRSSPLTELFSPRMRGYPFANTIPDSAVPTVTFEVYYKPEHPYHEANEDFYKLLHASPLETWHSHTNFTLSRHGRSGTTVSTSQLTPNIWASLVRSGAVAEVCVVAADPGLPYTFTGCTKPRFNRDLLTPVPLAINGRKKGDEEDECWAKFWEMTTVGKTVWNRFGAAGKPSYQLLLRTLADRVALEYPFTPWVEPVEWADRDEETKARWRVEWETKRWRFWLLDEVEMGIRAWDRGDLCTEYREVMEAVYARLEKTRFWGFTEEERGFWGGYWAY